MAICATCGEPVGSMLDEEGFVYVARCRCRHAATKVATPAEVLVRCADCKARISEAQWTQHALGCPGKVTCSRCGGRVSAARISEHRRTCGSYRALPLRRYILMGTASTPVAEFCAWCKLLVPVAELSAHQERCPQRLRSPSVPVPPASRTEWRTGQDYTLVVFSTLARQPRPWGQHQSLGQYYLATRNGRSRQARVQHREPYVPDQAEYLTLVAALADLVGRITAAGREPGAFTLTLYSRREPVIHQLAGLQPCHVTTAIAPFSAALAQLQRFADVELFCQEGPAIQALFGAMA